MSEIAEVEAEIKALKVKIDACSNQEDKEERTAMRRELVALRENKNILLQCQGENLVVGSRWLVERVCMDLAPSTPSHL